MINHYRNDLLRLFKYYNADKAKKKLIYIIKTLNEKKRKQKILKYFYKFKFITDFLKNKIDYQTSSSDLQIVTSNKSAITATDKTVVKKEETKEKEITEEMYIKYIKEKYLNNNKSQHISELSIDKNQKEKKPYEIKSKTKYNIPSINYTNAPKQLVDNETDMEKTPQEICTNEPINIIKPKKEYNEISIQYTDPTKRTSVTEVLNIIITKKINRNNLNIGKYFTKWYKITKEDIINEKANKIIKHVKGYLVRKKVKNNEMKNKGSQKMVDIYEQLMIKRLKKKWNHFVNICKI